MLTKKDIKKMAKRVLRRQRGLRDHQIIHPQRDWMIGFLSGVLLFVVGGLWSYITFEEIATRDVSSVITEEVQQTVYQEATVDRALRLFRERRASYEALLGNAQSTVVEQIEFIEDDETEPNEDIILIEDSIEVETGNEDVVGESQPEFLPPESTDTESEL